MHAHGSQAQHANEQHEPHQVKRPGTPADRILTLQRLAGNAAVARALDEEGLGEHGHGPGCDHDGPGPGGQFLQRQASLNAAIASPGRPLDPGIRTRAERAYPMDFGHMLMHDDPVARESARDFGARAYTVGHHIVAGEDLDEDTVFHEIDHAFHQAMGFGEGTDDGSGVRVSTPGDPFEVRADDNGRRVARGEMPDLSLAGGPPSPAGYGAYDEDDD